MNRFFAFIILALTASGALAQQYAAAIVLEPTTGRVLFESNSHQPLPVASMTKMMNLLVVLDHLREGDIKLDTQVPVSARASKMGGSQVYLKQGEQFTVRDLIAATMVHSGNDAAMALAEHIAGSGEAFVDLMNDKAQSLGLKESQFYSPHGLPAEKGVQDDVMSASDAARIGLELMKDPLMRQLAAQQQLPFRGGVFTLYNPNHLLRVFAGANGIKTGYHEKAGFCVTGSARRGDMDLIVVVMGSKIKRDNFDAASKLLSEAFSKYRMMEVVKQGARVGNPVIVKDGKTSNVIVVAGRPARALVARTERKNVKADLAVGVPSAPIKKGQQLGWVVVKNGNTEIARVPAIAANAVEKAPWWQKFWPF